jgi:uncharacterized membrane-anchored protein YitT (DUF2179 family)
MQPSSHNNEQSLPEKITKEQLSQYEMTRKAKILSLIKTVIFLLASSLLISFASYSLVEPNKFTTGGISGIAVLIHTKFPKIQQSAVLFSMNFPLLILAFIFVKRKFAILSASNVLLQTLWLILRMKAKAPRSHPERIGYAAYFLELVILQQSRADTNSLRCLDESFCRNGSYSVV